MLILISILQSYDMVKFGDSSGGIQVNQHRLFATEQEVLASIPSKKQGVVRSHYDYE